MILKFSYKNHPFGEKRSGSVGRILSAPDGA